MKAQLTPEVADRIIAAAANPEETLNVTVKAREAATELVQNAAREFLCGLDMDDLERVLSHFGYWVERGESRFGKRDYPVWMVGRRDYPIMDTPFEEESWAYDAAINDLLDGTSGAWILTEVVDGGLVEESVEG